ncbi:hypothetical protein [Brevundimonas sp.]|uniref:hypothetical protein n=1 Tax=Brevundimonas sp. TaxID=1871086 RepID=UPI00248A0EFD|nr:hypothetical protein [Brevundimonas sp.]MDI1282441.1 hypothetical protein [Brevundimonas sp.]
MFPAASTFRLSNDNSGTRKTEIRRESPDPILAFWSTWTACAACSCIGSTKDEGPEPNPFDAQPVKTTAEIKSETMRMNEIIL